MSEDSATTAFLFPGQGSVFPRMGADLVARWPAAREVYDRAAQVTGVDLEALAVTAPRQRLIETENAHLLVVVHALAVAAILEQAAIRPSYLCGHSLGQFAAVAAAGVLDLESALRLVGRRGALLASCCRRSPGGMIAVRRRSAEQVRALLAGLDDGLLVVSGVNGRHEITVSGEPAALREALVLFRRDGAAASTLPVAGAFHSPLVAPAAAAFARELGEVDWRDPERPVVSTESGALLTRGAEVRRDLEAHMLAPVRWDRVLATLEQRGVDRFLEVGPGKTLTGLVRHWNRRACVYATGRRASIEALCARLASASPAHKAEDAVAFGA